MLLALFLEHDAARDDDVAAALVELDDLEPEGLIEQLIQVLDLAQRDLAPGKERLDAVEVDDDTALDLAHEPAFDHLAGVGGVLDAIPDLDEVGALLGEDDQAVLVLHLLEEDLDLVTDLDALESRELVRLDDALGLETDVDEHFGRRDLEHTPTDDLSLFEILERLLVERFELEPLFIARIVGIVRILGQERPNPRRALRRPWGRV